MEPKTVLTPVKSYLQVQTGAFLNELVILDELLQLIYWLFFHMGDH